MKGTKHDKLACIYLIMTVLFRTLFYINYVLQSIYFVLYTSKYFYIN